jgi:peroxiredoxin
VISIDAADKLELLREKKGYTFPLLMDPDSETIKAYGILNERQGELPHPTALVIDPGGVIRYKRVDVEYKVRPAAADLLEVLHRLQD